MTNIADNKARIYLTAPRKQSYENIPSGWEEVYWNRGMYIESVIYEKSFSDLTGRDKELVKEYGIKPDEWI